MVVIIEMFIDVVNDVSINKDGEKGIDSGIENNFLIMILKFKIEFDLDM